jgi:hypothetical protein
MEQEILIAGATGNLGLRIAKVLTKKGANVRAIVRSSSDVEKISELKKLGIEVIVVSNWDLEQLTEACQGITCVVSVLAGLRDVIIDSQKILLDAAISAKVKRFIPSDYSLDFTKFSNGENRNLDLRREFHRYLDTCPIESTSIFNGAFSDLIPDQMPFILLKPKMILYWGKADFKWGFTTMDNTAEYTANVALDAQTPRYLRIASDTISPIEMRQIAMEVYGTPFKMFSPGGKTFLGVLIKIIRKFSSGENELYPAWQGMQYMHNMIDERSHVETYDNQRYSEIDWLSMKNYLLSAKNNEINKTG